MTTNELLYYAKILAEAQQLKISFTFFFYNSVLDRNIICRLLSPAIPSESPFYAHRSEDYFFFFTDIEICPKVASVIKKTMKTGYPTRII